VPRPPPGWSAGTPSLVMHPLLVTQLAPASKRGARLTASRIFAKQYPTSHWPPPARARSPAELGFDDHLTGAGNADQIGCSPALEPVLRPQRHHQVRRAALGTCLHDPALDAEHE
ncbi:hypothetical protein VM98_36085, partial [Streptomyces rubellomurinus subsp. indigoferus]